MKQPYTPKQPGYFYAHRNSPVHIEIALCTLLLDLLKEIENLNQLYTYPESASLLYLHCLLVTEKPSILESQSPCCHLARGRYAPLGKMATRRLRFSYLGFFLRNPTLTAKAVSVGFLDKQPYTLAKKLESKKFLTPASVIPLQNRTEKCFQGMVVFKQVYGPSFELLDKTAFLMAKLPSFYGDFGSIFPYYPDLFSNFY